MIRNTENIAFLPCADNRRVSLTIRPEVNSPSPPDRLNWPLSRS